MTVRLDALLVQQNLASSREKAKQMIQSGQVLIQGKPVRKPAALVEQDILLSVTSPGERFVSRGGYKLEKALNDFSISLEALHCLDIGASTGGFTDCMLQKGAAHVYAVDVGHGQLAKRLSDDPRVTSMEGINFRTLRPEHFPRPFDFATADVSFISLRLLFPVLTSLLSYEGKAVCLIKPQFEAGREAIGKGGIVKSSAVHEKVLQEITGFAQLNGFSVSGLTFSPICGGDGNIEYLLFLSFQAACISKAEGISPSFFHSLVLQAHAVLRKKAF